jgi:GNAT superfamily N-acetyltransferase
VSRRKTSSEQAGSEQAAPDRACPERACPERARREEVTSTSAGETLGIGPLGKGDRDALFECFSVIVERREGFPHEPPLTEEVFEETWVDDVTITVVARLGSELAGAYYLKPNFAGRAAHIANAGYMVRPALRGLGIGSRLVEDSVRRAPLLGFDAIQFNLVFETNPARALYERFGWRVVGRLPAAVGGEDCLIYWRPVP